MTKADAPLTEDVETLRLAYTLLSERAQSLRDKQWNVFSWANGILIAICTGLLGLFGIRGFRFEPFQGGCLVSVVVTISFYSVAWLIHNFQHKEAIMREVDCLAKRLQIPIVPKRGSWIIGYVTPIVFLAIVDIVAIYFIAQMQPG